MIRKIILTILIGLFLICLSACSGLKTGQGFGKYAIYKLPQRPGVYVLWQEGSIIHVGMSGNLRQRISGHPKKNQMTSFDWYQTRTIDEARQLENELKEKYEYQDKKR